MTIISQLQTQMVQQEKNQNQKKKKSKQALSNTQCEHCVNKIVQHSLSLKQHE